MKRILSILLICVFAVSCLSAQEVKKSKKEKKEAYSFINETELKATTPKDQAKTGTCWCFATLSFLESELLRLGRGEFNLSEMYVVRNTYPLKAENYYRMHGYANFGEGGQMHDVLNSLREYGAVPEEVYTGMNIEEPKHNHSEMTEVLESMLRAAVKTSKITPRWKDAFNSVLDVYLGKRPESFVYQGKTYTPKTFLAEAMGLNLDDYVEITSYDHHPFYQKMKLEIPDNWSGGEYYNIPIDELESVIDSSLRRGFTVAWDGDVSDHDFSTKKGYAVAPVKSWDEKTADEKDNKITSPEPEKEVTQQMRQTYFDNFTTTDDHVMHITGMAHNQDGSKFYITKNSYGSDGKYNGYIYMSRPYVRLNTVAILVHKDAIPSEIARKIFH